MFEEKGVETERLDEIEEGTDEFEPSKGIEKQNEYLQGYFESIDPTNTDLLIDNDYEHILRVKDHIEIDGMTYSLKVNTFTQFVTFMQLVENDDIVYPKWMIFCEMFDEMVKWFYLCYLNKREFENPPPRIEGIEVSLLALHKLVQGYGGYMFVTLNGLWGRIASLIGLEESYEKEMKACYIKYLDLVLCYYHTAKPPRNNDVKEMTQHNDKENVEKEDQVDMVTNGIGETSGVGSNTNGIENEEASLNEILEENASDINGLHIEEGNMVNEGRVMNDDPRDDDFVIIA